MTAGLVLAVTAALLGPAGPSTASDTNHDIETGQSARLNLGATDLSEKRTVSTFAPGVTLTKISRGGTDSSLFWTDEVAIPSASTDPDAPAPALSSQADGQRVAHKLKAAGVDSRVEHGLIRNCGAKSDLPTELPQQDVTGTNPDELVTVA
ncbi:hypothetical protein [Pseudarthrobacter sp. N5]|uniref:hypothetical protein n=1 Tax=Pseudarthrobacter sp. N5 TaxID=3418416 RepID=UPI003CE86DAB